MPWWQCPECCGKKDYYALACRRCTVPKKPLSGRKGAAHPAWKGGTRIDKDGYLIRYAPDHPWPRGSGYVRENVRIMELHLGRRIATGETVHHVDENKLNNDLSNLELISRSEHARRHALKNAPRRGRTASGKFNGDSLTGEALGV